MSIGPAPACYTCKRFVMEFANWHCAAFPNGIPDEITTGGNRHTSHVQGDHGLLVDPMTPAEIDAQNKAELAWLDKIGIDIKKGGSGSGNFNHAGIPGEQGGSMPGAGNVSHPNVKAHPRKKELRITTEGPHVVPAHLKATYENNTLPLRRSLKFDDQVVFFDNGALVNGQIDGFGADRNMLKVRTLGSTPKVYVVPRDTMRMPKGGFRTRGE